MSKQKIGVLSDTHIGYSGNASLHNEFGEMQTDRTTDEGVNIRTEDVNNALKQSIDIFIENKVGIVLHAGDGMNFWGYKYPSYFNFYMEQINRLSENGIQYVEIAGNHNFAKKAGVGCELEKLSMLPYVRTMYRGKLEVYEIPETNIVVHALPSTFDKETFDDEISRVEMIPRKFNIFLTHCGVTDIDYYAQSETSAVAHLDVLKGLNMDLTILGDYHKFVDFGDHIYYPGATERFSFAEADENPRVLIFDIDDSSKEISLSTKFLDVRPMINLPSIDAEDKGLSEIQAEITTILKSNPIEDSIVRLRIENLPKTMKHRHLFLTEEIRELQKKTLILKLDFKNKMTFSENVKTMDDIEVESILEGFQRFVTELPDNPEVTKEKVVQYGKKYLHEVMEDENH